MSDIERVHRVAYIDTDKSQQEVRQMLSHCGDIRGVYPWKSGNNQSSTHFFVEFDEKSSVKRAKAAQVPDAKVHVLAFSPQLIAHFSMIVPPSGPSRKFKQEVTDVDSSPGVRAKGFATPKRPRSQDRKRTNSNRNLSCMPSFEHKKPSRRTSSNQYPNALNDPHTPDHKSPRSHPISGIEKENCSTDGALCAYVSSMTTALRNEGDRTASSELPHRSPTASISSSRLPSPSHPMFPTNSQDIQTASLPTPMRCVPSALMSLSVETSVPVPPRTSASSSPASASPSIVLTCDGGRYICDLDALTEDPQAVISILTQTAAHALERDKWMIVAGHYRGKGNTEAALAVVSAMVDVLTSSSVGMTEIDLRPAFLMLSCCHTELGKSARATKGDSASITQRHFRKSQECLQKVYGANPDILSGQSEMGARLARSFLVNASNLNAPIGGDPKPETKSSNQYSRVLILQREVQSLRDRNSSNMVYLSQARAAKRKMEDDLEAERRTRRKLQDDLDAATKELVRVRRGEKHALEQCKREVESRRRADDRALQLREDLADMSEKMDMVRSEASVKERKARECFGRLGLLFLRAAKGELENAAGFSAAGFMTPSRSSAAFEER